MTCEICGQLWSNSYTFDHICSRCREEPHIVGRERRWMDQSTIMTQVVESFVPGWGMVRHLKVWREDGRDISWDELQETKNERLGQEAKAIEVYPRQEDLVNETNMRHLWEVPPGMHMPNLADRR